MPVTPAETERRFNFYPASDKAIQDQHTTVRETCRDAADRIVGLTPSCREQSLAVTALEEAMMWANAAIARPEAAF